MAATFRKRVRQSVEREDTSESLQENEQESFSTDELSGDESAYCDLNTSTTSNSSSSRKGRGAMKRQRYLSGTSQKPYRISNEIQKALSDNEQGSSSSQAMASHEEPSQWNKNVCESCAPVLQKYVDTFHY